MGRLVQPVLSVPLNRGQIDKRASLEGILTGILADLGSRSVTEITDCVPETVCFATLRPWIHVLDMGRFKPREIRVKVTDTKVCVHARHEDNDGENMDLIERRRTVKIPRYVNAKKIVCFLNRCGKFIIQAPFDVQEHSKPTGGKNNEKENNEVGQNHAELNTENLPSVQQPNTSDMKIECIEQKNINVKEEEPKHSSIQNDDTPPGEKTNALETKEGPAEPNTEMEAEISVKKCNESQTSSMDYQDTKSIASIKCASRSQSPVLPGEPIVPAENKNGLSRKCVEPIDTQRHVLKPLSDSVQVIEYNGQKFFSVKLNLNHFEIDNVSVTCQDDTLCIGAIREYEDSGSKGYQEFYRQYQLPKHISEGEARAFITEEGILDVKVPIRESYATDTSVGQM